jgi:hypothetical protein
LFLRFLLLDLLYSLAAGYAPSDLRYNW